MKQKRYLSALLSAVCLAALLLSLAACGAMSDGAWDAVAPGYASGGASQTNGWDGGWYDKDAGYDYAPESPSASGDLMGSASIPTDAKMIFTADMTLQTTEFESAVQALDRIVSGLGGYFESRTLNQGGSYRRLYCTVRVPAEHFTAFLDQAGQAAHTTYRQEYATNVSEAYYDTEARLTTQRTKLERLQELLAQADNMADILTLESAISETELQIEYLTGSLRRYDSLIGYATITLSLEEVYRLSDDEEPAVTFGQRMASAFSAGLRQTVEDLEDFAVSLARNWVGVLVFLAIAAAAAGLIVRSVRRRKRDRAAAQPAQPIQPTQETKE